MMYIHVLYCFSIHLKLIGRSVQEKAHTDNLRVKIIIQICCCQTLHTCFTKQTLNQCPTLTQFKILQLPYC